MSLYSDIKNYIHKVEQGTYGAVGSITGTLIGLPVASLVELTEVFQGSKSLHDAPANIMNRYGAIVNGGEQFARKHAPEITEFLQHMTYEIAREKGKEQARGRNLEQ
jgi:hypothetical protein